MDWNTFCNNLEEVLELKRYSSKYLKWKFSDTDLEIEYYLEQNKLIKFTYTKRKFINDYKNIQEVDELKIVNENYNEVPISLKSDFFPMLPRYDRIMEKEYNDNENNIKYKITTPSKQFWLKIIELKIKPHIVVMLRRLFFIFERHHDIKENEMEYDIFELLKMIYRNFFTLQIFSVDSYSEEYFSKLTDAFIFNINYNTDIGIRQAFDTEGNEIRRTDRFRREIIDEIAPPRKIYKKELVEQYNMANISDEPFIKYLCYYHILEHFYEAVYKEDMIKTVKETIALPSFSIKKDVEIIKLINIIKNKIKYERESFDGDELEALELVIKKYVNIKTLKDKIESIDSKLVNYYDSETVEFSKGIPINFNDVDNLYKNIAKRVYFTRNALVHYKSNSFSKNKRGIYRPFRDRKDLLKEIPLIRILAEEVIITDAEII